MMHYCFDEGSLPKERVFFFFQAHIADITQIHENSASSLRNDSIFFLVPDQSTDDGFNIIYIIVFIVFL